MLGRYWPAVGQRHEAALAAAGLLVRAGVREADVVKIVMAAAKAAGDVERTDRNHAARDTVAALRSGAAATGGPRLAEVLRDGDRVVARLRKWLGADGSERFTFSGAPAGHAVDSYIEPLGTFLAEDDPPTRWIFPELLPTDVLMLIHGEPRARKSLVGFELALSAATGTAPFGLRAYQPDEAIRVWWIQEEDARSLTRPRVRRLVQERCGTIPGTLHVSVRRGIDLDDPVWVTRIIADAQRLGIRFLVLDAARRLSVKTDEGPAKVRELIAGLRALVTEAGLTIAIVHHDVKPPANGQDVRRRSQRASGGDWFAACECPVHIERMNDTESLVYPQDYKFSADPDPFTFTCALDGKLIKALVGVSTTPESAETAGERGRCSPGSPPARPARPKQTCGRRASRGAPSTPCLTVWSGPRNRLGTREKGRQYALFCRDPNHPGSWGQFDVLTAQSALSNTSLESSPSAGTVRDAGNHPTVPPLRGRVPWDGSFGTVPRAPESHASADPGHLARSRCRPPSGPLARHAGE